MALLLFDRTCHRLSYRVIIGGNANHVKQKLSASFDLEMMQIITQKPFY